MEMALVELERLRLHEEPDLRVLLPLLHEIEEDGVLWSPVIVDRESMVVLDGTHRVTALRMLGCRYACAYLVDYSRPEIGVDRWFRAIPEPFDAERAQEVAGELGLELIPLEPSGVGNVSYPVLRLRNGSHYALAPRLDAERCYDALRVFERRLEYMGYRMDYKTEAEAEEKLTSKAVSALLQPPTVGKEQVVFTARLGRALSCKATRHIIPGRPVGVDVPLTLLRDRELSVEEANLRLAALIEGMRTETLPPGTVWRGQRYDEQIQEYTEDAGVKELKTHPAGTIAPIFNGDLGENLPMGEPPRRFVKEKENGGIAYAGLEGRCERD